MHRSTAERKNQGNQGVKKNMHRLLLNISLEHSIKKFGSQVTDLSETNFQKKERFILEILSNLCEVKVNNFAQKCYLPDDIWCRASLGSLIDNHLVNRCGDTYHCEKKK
jgi:hypothetical protein